jgi:hypothetical protein
MSEELLASRERGCRKASIGATGPTAPPRGKHAVSAVPLLEWASAQGRGGHFV